MDGEKTGRPHRALIIAAVAVLAAAAGTWWYLAGRCVVPEAAVRVAERLPAGTPLLVWTADLETLLSAARDAGLALVPVEGP